MASNRGIRRTYNSPAGYKFETEGRIAQFNQTYIGFVMDNRDALKMGRLKVWIPEFSTDKNNSNQWITVNYCSPFAGATSIGGVKKDGKDLASAQQSYGWWSVPPDLDNEVVVLFINGDPNRGIYIGGLYQQFMNHMVPGIAPNKSFDPGVDGYDPPVGEYNKWSTIGTDANPTRPRYTPLHQALKSQGLYEDASRGTTTASARRGSADLNSYEFSRVFGFLSPGGSQLVFDDGDTDSSDRYIRVRTSNGAQLVINDTVGYIYAITRSGNTWIEMSDDALDMYTAKSFSVRSQQDINFHADGNINMHAKGNFNTYTGGTSAHQVGKDYNLKAGGLMNLQSGSDMNLISGNDLNMSATRLLGLLSNGTIGFQASKDVGITSNTTIYMNAPKIQQNVGQGPKPNSGSKSATTPSPGQHSDRELNVNADYPEIETQSIVSRMPTHEPYALHPTSPVGPAAQKVDLSVSTRIQIDGSAEPTTNPDDLQPGQEQVIPTDDSTWVIPATGRITSPFGPRKPPTSGASSIHQGVDIANAIGTPIVATKAGTVIKAGPGTGYGNVIYLDHGNGQTSRYAHLSAFKCSQGQSVKQGQVIGLMGNTGVGTGPHCHFEIRINGSAIDPSSKLPELKKGNSVVAGKS